MIIVEIAFTNVELPPDRLCDPIWREQIDRFFPEYSHTTQGNNSP